MQFEDEDGLARRSHDVTRAGRWRCRRPSTPTLDLKAIPLPPTTPHSSSPQTIRICSTVPPSTYSATPAHASLPLFVFPCAPATNPAQSQHNTPTAPILCQHQATITPLSQLSPYSIVQEVSMSGQVAPNVHPKTPRPKHRHSKSAVAVPTEGGQQPNQSQQRTGRRAHERKQGQTTPAWQDAVATPEVTGDFDSDGNFISAPTTNGVHGLDNDSPTEKGQAQKGRRKQRPKEVNQNVATQPRPEGNAIPPKEVFQHTQVVLGQAPNYTQTPAKSTAYAGSGWHASPAASALPMPKFFSKSVPANSSQTSLQARLEQEKENSDMSESPPQEEATPAKPPPAQAAVAQLPRQSESPLDFFFKADREEKASRFMPVLEVMFRTN